MSSADRYLLLAGATYYASGVGDVQGLFRYRTEAERIGEALLEEHGGQDDWWAVIRIAPATGATLVSKGGPDPFSPFGGAWSVGKRWKLREGLKVTT